MVQNTKILLIAQMKRAIELLESEQTFNGFYSKEKAELFNKLHEIRRDSIRLEKTSLIRW